MTERLHPIMTLIDQGLTLYRRHFWSFVLIAASWFVPVAIAVGLAVLLGEQLDSTWVLLGLLVAAVAFFVLLIYLVGGLSRAAALAADEQPLRFGEVMRFHPLRVFGMTCFSVVYLILSYILSTAISFICICPLYIFGALGIGGLASIGGSDTFGIIGISVFGLIFAGVYLLLLIVGGAGYSGLIYGLQPFSQERGSFGTALQHSLELIGYRFWRNIAVWGLTAVLTASIGLTVTITFALLISAPLAFLAGEESVWVQAISASAWMVGFVLVLPPLPIWMALLYRRNRAARDGADLQERVDAWQQLHFGTAPEQA